MQRTPANDGLYPDSWYDDTNLLDPHHGETPEQRTDAINAPSHWSNPGLMFDPAYHPSTRQNEDN